jgi:transcriptional regulator
MYVPAHFAATDLELCHRVIREYPFAPIATPAATGELIASHLPFLLDAERGRFGTLVAHMARANEHADLLSVSTASLVVFTGPHAYISPTWYAAQPAVPTWNYCAVHATGAPRLLDEAATRAYLTRLAQRFEGRSTGAWSFELQPAEFQAKMLRGIVAFELEIEGIQGKAKLSQNRPPDDIPRVIAALRASTVSGDSALAEWMAALTAE